MSNKFLHFFFVFLMLVLVLDSLSARRGGGFSSRRSFSSSRSISRSRTTSVRRSSSRSSSVSKQSYNRAKQNGTLYSSKQDATKSFKSKYSTQYSSKFSSKPNRRPDHIPTRTQVNGSYRDIRYNSQYGGYGYLNTLGTFILYDALSDAVMMNSLMNRHNYYYGMGSTYGYSFNFFSFAVVLFLLFLVGSFLMNSYRR